MPPPLDPARATRRGFWVAGGVLVLLIAAAIGMLWHPPPSSSTSFFVVRPSSSAASPVRASYASAVRRALFAEIQPVNVSNCEMRRLGEVNDGGYILCANLLGAVQAGYSYGISGYDGWGCEVSTRLHVVVHQYDCFNLTEPKCPDGMTIFHGECVGTTRSVQDGRPFDSLAGQFARNGDASKRLVMKMDVEGAEWDTFLFAPDSVFEHIDQLDVEFHHVDDPKFVAVMQRLKGFYDIAHVHYNNFSCDPDAKPFPTWAFEVLLVNKRIAMSDGTPGAVSPTALDAANNPKQPDCQVASR